MKEVWNVNAAVTEGLIEKLNKKENIWFRFQDKGYDIDSEHSESWGMIYGTKEEAIENWMEDYDCDEEEAEEEAILPGKSCMPTLEGIRQWAGEFDSENYVIIAFCGTDTYVSGHDGEYVAEFDEAVAVFDMDEALAYLDRMDIAA